VPTRRGRLVCKPPGSPLEPPSKGQGLDRPRRFRATEPSDFEDSQDSTARLAPGLNPPEASRTSRPSIPRFVLDPTNVVKPGPTISPSLVDSSPATVYIYPTGPGVAGRGPPGLPRGIPSGACVATLARSTIPPRHRGQRPPGSPARDPVGGVRRDLGTFEHSPEPPGLETVYSRASWTRFAINPPSTAIDRNRSQSIAIARNQSQSLAINRNRSQSIAIARNRSHPSLPVFRTGSGRGALADQPTPVFGPSLHAGWKGSDANGPAPSYPVSTVALGRSYRGAEPLARLGTNTRLRVQAKGCARCSRPREASLRRPPPRTASDNPTRHPSVVSPQSHGVSTGLLPGIIHAGPLTGGLTAAPIPTGPSGASRRFLELTEAPPAHPNEDEAPAARGILHPKNVTRYQSRPSGPTRV